MSRINVEVLENIFKTLFSALNIYSMNPSEVNSVLDNLVDEETSEGNNIQESSPILVEYSESTLTITGNFKIK